MPPLHSHPRANELIRNEPERERPRGPVERRIARTVLLFVVGLGLAAAVIAALLFDRPGLAAIATLLFVPMMLLFLAPVILARSIQVTQDEAVRREASRLSGGTRSRPSTSRRRTSGPAAEPPRRRGA